MVTLLSISMVGGRHSPCKAPLAHLLPLVKSILSH